MTKTKVSMLIALFLGLTYCAGEKPADKPLSDQKAFFSCPCPQVLAHRGASGYRPENTVASFQLALEQGADILEMDVHLSKDDQLVVHHDASLQRTTGNKADIKSLSLGEIQKLDAGKNFSKDGGKTFPFRNKGIRIPTLLEVLRKFPTSKINIEIKPENPDVANALSTLLKNEDARSRVMIGSEHASVMERLDQLGGGRILRSATAMEVLKIYLGYVFGLDAGIKANALQIPVSASVGPLTLEFDGPEFIKFSNLMELPVHFWTINKSTEMKKLFQRGAQGVITNYPDLAVAARSRLD